MCFVAVQDQECGAVVTVLPIDYHETLAWPVSAAAQEAARRLVAALPRGAMDPAGPTAEDDGAGAPSGSARPTARSFRVTAYVRDDLDNVRVVKLGSWPSAPYQQQAAELSKDGLFLRTIRQWLRDRNILPERLDAVYVRVGQRSAPVRLERVDFD
jgi:hypothetical protein